MVYGYKKEKNSFFFNIVMEKNDNFHDNASIDKIVANLEKENGVDNEANDRKVQNLKKVSNKLIIVFVVLLLFFIFVGSIVDGIFSVSSNKIKFIFEVVRGCPD